MATPVELPQLGNTVEECLITRWVKRKGDTVAAGDIVVEIETDKTTFEIAAPVDGTVLETFFEAGALVEVFTNIFVIGEPGEAVEAFGPRSAVRSPHSAVRSPPSALPEPQWAAVDSSGGSGLTTEDRGARGAAWSPRARRLAARHNVAPSAIAGSGPGGRVLEADVRRALASAAPARPAVSGLRATIARRMRDSLAATAQYTLHASADAAGLLATRAKLKNAAGLPDITINDLVTFCVVQALREAPDVNAELLEGRIVAHSEVHIAFAVDTPRGLLAPVVRAAHAMGVAELAARMKTLAAQAAAGTISPGDLSGGTFTVSNLGALGIESFTPLINLPQVAILGVGAIQVKPVRVGGAVQFVDALGLSLTCDHQVIDGAPGARFLKVVAQKIENVGSLAGF